MSAIPQTDRWVDFFKMYRQLPALWRVTDEHYKNQRAKKAAYDRLLECYQKIDPNATVDSMRRRINGIRTCYRREERKVEQSEVIFQNTDDVYVPHLWYFNELSFLRSDTSKTAHFTTVAETSNSFWKDDDMEGEESDNTELKDDWSENETKVFEPTALSEPAHPESPVTQPCLEPSPPAVEQPQPSTKFQTPLGPNLNHTLRDEAAIYAEGWATSYRKLDERNKLLAKKAIEEILVLGQLNKLEFNSVKMPN